jgi:hypothetical protein
MITRTVDAIWVYTDQEFLANGDISPVHKDRFLRASLLKSMFRRHRVLALRWILPIAQLVLSIAILWPVRHELTQQVKDASRYSRLTKTRAPTVSEVIAISIPERFTPQERAELASFERRKWMPAVLNLPSGLIQLPYIALNASKEEWVPVGLDLMTWRAITWPLLGIIFWWRVGRGIEALLATRRGIDSAPD